MVGGKVSSSKAKLLMLENILLLPEEISGRLGIRNRLLIWFLIDWI